MYDKHNVNRKYVHELNFKITIKNFEFEWFLSVIDWERFQFKIKVAAEIVNVDYQLVWWYSYAECLIQDLAYMLNLCCKQLINDDGLSAMQDELLQLMAYLCLYQYHRDALTLLKKEIVCSVKTDKKKNAILFCYEGL